MVRIMETETHAEKSAFSHGEPVFDMAFDQMDGRPSLLVAAGDTVYQDLLQAPDLTNEACFRVSRNLTRAEWKAYVPEVSYNQTCPQLPLPK